MDYWAEKRSTTSITMDSPNSCKRANMEKRGEADSPVFSEDVPAF
jgi:hypothetical protein